MAPAQAPEAAPQRRERQETAEEPAADCAFWVTPEFLFWNVTRMGRPALVTTSPAGTPLAQAGVLGAGATELVGGRDLGELRAGFRLNAGFWLDESAVWSVEGNFFVTEQIVSRAQHVSDGTTILARPLFNALADAEGSKVVAYPGAVRGAVTVDADSTLWGMEANLRRGIWGNETVRLDGMVGARYLRLRDYLLIRDSELVTGAFGGLPVGTISAVADQFRASNDFCGVQAGLAGRLNLDCITLDGYGKLAVGNVHQVVILNGSTRIRVPGRPERISEGGLLALSSNSGRHTRHRLAVVPEFGVSAGCQVTEWLRLSIGYSALILSDAVRSGEIVDRRVNPALLPPVQPTTGPIQPAFGFRSSWAWAQGISLSAELRW